MPGAVRCLSRAVMQFHFFICVIFWCSVGPRFGFYFVSPSFTCIFFSFHCPCVVSFASPWCRKAIVVVTSHG